MPLRLQLQRILLAFLTLAGLYSSIQYFVWTFTAGTIDFDPVANWETRFAPVRAALPIQRGMLGYVADWDIPGADFDQSDQDAEFILTQYAFSPLILRRSADYEWIVGSLRPASYKKWVEIRQGQYEDYAFKGNVYLFHRLDLPK